MNVVRAVIESNYKGLCDIYEYRETINEETRATQFTKEVVYKEVPCRLSFSSGGTADKGEVYNGINQITELFIAPEIEIKAGSRFVITQNGITKEFVRNGEPMIYETHQQIFVELCKEEA